MKFTQKTPKADITIQGQKYQVPQPYAPEHVCTEAEAKALNGLIAENARNNFARRLKKINEENGKLAEGVEPQPMPSQAELDDYLKSYEIGARKIAVQLSPLDKEKKRLASEMLTTALRAKGRQKKDLTTEAVEGLLQQILTKYEATIHTQAESNIALRSQMGEIELD